MKYFEHGNNLFEIKIFPFWDDFITTKMLTLINFSFLNTFGMTKKILKLNKALTFNYFVNRETGKDVLVDR